MIYKKVKLHIRGRICQTTLNFFPKEQKPHIRGKFCHIHAGIESAALPFEKCVHDGRNNAYHNRGYKGATKRGDVKSDLENAIGQPSSEIEHEGIYDEVKNTERKNGDRQA